MFTEIEFVDAQIVLYNLMIHHIFCACSKKGTLNS